MQNFAETKELVLRYCIKCIEMEQKFCEVCAHFSGDAWYYNNRKNPPIHYIVFATPHKKKYLLQNSQSKDWLFYFREALDCGCVYQAGIKGNRC